jgi:pilus assembly protein CpaD
MRSKFALLLIATAASAGCSYHPAAGDLRDRGVEAVNVPVVTRADYVFDAAAPGGSLGPSEKARLDAWFRGLDLGYGDSIYVDAMYANGARYDVAQVAGNYGMMVQPGAPVTAGAVPQGMVRVIVSRTRAEVPNCPNWSTPSQPNYNNRSMSNFGCGVNSDLAAMVANPEDLIHGRESSDIGDNTAGTKAVILYRSTPPTGTKGLQSINTTKKDSQ